MKAVGMFAQGISAFDAGKYTRKVMATNSQNALNDGVAERDRIRFAARQAMGQQLVDQGGSGFASGTGSALDALKESAISRELDFAVSRRRASMAAAGYKQQGDLAYAQGKSAMAGGILSGAAEIASEVAGAFGGVPSGGGGASIAPPNLSSPWAVNINAPAPSSLPVGNSFGSLPGMLY
jgi:hypothetical protein